MRDYGVVHSTYWTSATSHDFSDDAKLLGVYLLTGPHSSALGCFRIPDGYVTDDLKWDIKRVREGFKELLAKGWANRCETTKWVFIYNYLKFNPPENPNQRKSLRRLASQVPDNATFLSDLEAALLLHCGPLSQAEMFDEKSKGSETLSQPFRNQDQDQDQDHIQNQIKSVSSEPSGSKPSSPANGSVKVLINLPMLGKKEFPIDEHQAREWESLYPAVDVLQELRKMRGWLLANPSKRKIKVLRFANTWLAKEQDRAPARPSTPKSFTQDSAEIPWGEKSQGEKSGLVNLWTRDVRGGWEKMSEDERGKRVRLLVENYPFVPPEQWPKWMQPHLAASKKARA